MGKYAKEEWYKRRLADYKAQYGEVPPPWIHAKNSHPYSIRWRMGEGETLMMVFYEWWEEQKWSEAERVAYFRKWPPPPRWIPWMADRIWDLQSWESAGQFDYARYYPRLKQFGFQGVEDIEREDDKQRERTILATCAPFIQQARRRFDEGADVTTVARDLGAPLQSVSDLFVLHQLWASQNTKPAASFEGTKAALVFGRFLRGVDDATVERELGLAPEEVRRLRDQYDELASLPPFDPDIERPHRFGDVYTWLTVQKQQGASHVLLTHSTKGATRTALRIPFEANAPDNIDVADGTQAVMDRAGDLLAEGRLLLQAYAPGATSPKAVVLLFQHDSGPSTPTAKN